MQKTILRYGLYGFVTALGLFGLALLLGDGLNYITQQVIGYATMVTSLSFVYFGIKHYRDTENAGKLSFLRALVIGLLISVFSALGIALFDFIYTSFINPDFASEYLATTLAEMKETMTSTEFEAEKAKLTRQMEDYGQPYMMAIMMFLSTFIIGMIITIISSLILKSK